jgi:hypothetical protein
MQVSNSQDEPARFIQPGLPAMPAPDSDGTCLSDRPRRESSRCVRSRFRTSGARSARRRRWHWLGASCRKLVGVEPLLGPRRKGGDCRLERLPLRRQPVLDGPTRIGQDRSLDDPLPPQLEKTLAQHRVAQPRHRSANVGVRRPSGEKRSQDRPGPSAADQLDGEVIARAEAVHGCDLSTKGSCATQ